MNNEQIELFSFMWFVAYAVAILASGVIAALQFLLIRWVIRRWNLKIRVESVLLYGSALGICLLNIGIFISMPLLKVVGAVLLVPLLGVWPLALLYFAYTTLAVPLIRRLTQRQR